MFYRKLYLKTRLYLYSIRYIINTVFVFYMSATILWLVLNSFVFGTIINNLSNNASLSGKYPTAIKLYKTEYFYYSMFHFTEDNKEIYFGLPYKIAHCYLKNNQKNESIAAMVTGITKIHSQYGIVSRETAYFVRKYLIEYYLDNEKYALASKQFQSLLYIYKKIGYDEVEMADMIRLCGDLYYAQKQYEQAMDFYRKAYDLVSKQKKIDYDTFVKIVNRVAEYEVLNGKYDVAIDLYSKTATALINSGGKQNEYAANMFLALGSLYAKKPKTKDAIKCYEEAIVLIKKLPRTTYLRQNLQTHLQTLKDLYNDDGQFHKVDEVEVELARERRFSFF